MATKEDRLLFKATALLSALVLFGTNATADSFDPMRPTYPGNPFPYDHLSNEELDPFLVFRRQSHREDEVRAVSTYPSVRNCLVEDAQVSSQPDLRKIDWKEMRTQAIMSVCLFRIFSSYGSPEKAALWFAEQGLEVNGPFESSFTPEPTIGVKAHQNPQVSGYRYVGRRLPFGTPFSYILEKLIPELVYSESFTAYWSKETGELVFASYSASVK
jgi:hypothetical protein